MASKSPTGDNVNLGSYMGFSESLDTTTILGSLDTEAGQKKKIKKVAEKTPLISKNIAKGDLTMCKTVHGDRQIPDCVKEFSHACPETSEVHEATISLNTLMVQRWLALFG